MNRVIKTPEYLAEEKHAKGFLKRVANTVGDEAIEDVVVPTIERVMRGDVAVVDLAGFEGKGLVRVLRAPSLGARLRKMGIVAELAAVAVRFAADFEKARIGGLTANYEGGGGKGRHSVEPERWCDAIDLLSQACGKCSDDERVALFGYVVFDVAAADLGAFLGGNLSQDRDAQIFLQKWVLNRALIKLVLFYQDYDWRKENAETTRKGLSVIGEN